MTQNYARRWLLAAATTLTVLLSSLPAQAAQIPVSVAPSGAAVGLLAHLTPGAKVFEVDGSSVFLESISVAGLGVSNGKALGLGWHSFDFSKVATEAQAKLAATQLAVVPGVLAVDVNRKLASSSARAAGSASTRVQSAGPRVSFSARSLAALKPASVPTNVHAVDAWNLAEAATSQLRLTWSKPKSTYSATIIGYRVQTSIDAGLSWQTQLTKSAPTTYSLLVRKFDAGTVVSFRVAAVTKLGKLTKLGTYSKPVSAAATTVPQAPIFVGSRIATSARTPGWQVQNLVERGGLPVSYDAIASAAGYASVTCHTDLPGANSCSFTGLVPGVSYKVSVTVTNLRGTAQTVELKSVTDPKYPMQWSLNTRYGVHAEWAWERTRGAGAVVAVLDSGSSSHPDLDGQYLRNADGSVAGYDFVSLESGPGDGDGWDANPQDSDPSSDFHGVHVSGIVAAASNDIGVVGIAPEAKLLEVRVLGSDGGTSADLIAALNWSAGLDVANTPKNSHPANVINLSLGKPVPSGCDGATEYVLRALFVRNVAVITAAGNDGALAENSYPGNCVPTINVGASNFDGDKTFYSNVGEATNILAPGGDDTPITGSINPGTGYILSTIIDAGAADYGYMAGTSQAAPLVTGTVALMYSLRPQITIAQIWEALSKTASPFAAGSYCEAASASIGCGEGILNAGAALEYVAAGQFTAASK